MLPVSKICIRNLHVAVNGFIFMGANLCGLNKYNGFVGFKISGQKSCLHNSNRISLFGFVAWTFHKNYENWYPSESVAINSISLCFVFLRLFVIPFGQNAFLLYTYWYDTCFHCLTSALNDMCPAQFLKRKGRDLTQSYDKSPYTHRKIPKTTWQHKNATKIFDYTAIADRLRTVSSSSSSRPIGVVKPVYERSTFPLTATAV